jgi:hypothetical protein
LDVGVLGFFNAIALFVWSNAALDSLTVSARGHEGD